MNHDAVARTITENNSYSERAANIQRRFTGRLCASVATGILVTFENNWISIVREKGIRGVPVITGYLLQTV